MFLKIFIKKRNVFLFIIWFVVCLVVNDKGVYYKEGVCIDDCLLIKWNNKMFKIKFLNG